MARSLLGLRKSATSAAGRLSSSSIAGEQRKLRSMAGDLAGQRQAETRGATSNNDNSIPYRIATGTAVQQDCR